MERHWQRSPGSSLSKALTQLFPPRNNVSLRKLQEACQLMEKEGKCLFQALNLWNQPVEWKLAKDRYAGRFSMFHYRISG